MNKARKNIRITVNGVEYNNLSEAPPEVRRLLEDRDGNGIPDRVDKAIAAGEAGCVRTSTTYVLDGKTYASPDDMPPEVRRLFEDRNGDGVPDIAQRRGMALIPAAGTPGTAPKAPATERTTVPECVSTLPPAFDEGPRKHGWTKSLAWILLLVGAAAAVVVALRVLGVV